MSSLPHPDPLLCCSCQLSRSTALVSSCPFNSGWVPRIKGSFSEQRGKPQSLPWSVKAMAWELAGQPCSGTLSSLTPPGSFCSEA